MKKISSKSRRRSHQNRGAASDLDFYKKNCIFYKSICIFILFFFSVLFSFFINTQCINILVKFLVSSNGHCFY